MMDPAVAANPFPVYEELRARGPVVVTKGAVFVTGFDAATALYRDNRLGHGDPKVSWLQRLAFPDHYKHLVHPLEPPSMISVDPPAHTRYRKLVARAFSVKKVEALAPRVAELADGLLDELLRDPQADVMTGYAAQLPVLVIADMLGVPLSDQALFKEWGYDVARTLDSTMSWAEVQSAKQSLTKLNAYFDDAFAERRTQPRPDLLTALVQSEVDGETLSRDELLSTALLLLVAGFETTVNLLGNAITHVCADPELQRVAADADDAWWERVVEETLRFDSPVQFTSRMVLEPGVTIEGVDLQVGQLAALLIGAANRDPAVFEDPNRFWPDREPKPHLAFVNGIHFCLGAALARLEGRIGLQRLFRAAPHLQLGTPVRRPSALLRGYRSMPATLDPKRAPVST
jgi:cytochrome P450